jgi:putative ABC transport system permease protein
MFDSQDIQGGARTCVLGATPLRALFGDTDPLGQTVTLAGTLPCRVIGVLASKGFSTGGNDIDNVVLIPNTTFAAYLDAGGTYWAIETQPSAPWLLDTARAEIIDILRRTHAVVPGQEDDFRVTSPMDVVRAAESTSHVLEGLLRAIAAVSLLVGGIGIMNIQLVSVAERTNEIGIRAAIGASPRQIMTQFLFEAFALTAVGALSGVALGLLVAVVTARVMQWPQVISPLGALGSAGFGTLIGLTFGFLPARRAAELDPIEALRRE